MEAEDESMGDCCDGCDGRLYGGTGHLDRERSAAVYCRRTWSEPRRKYLGAHNVSGGERSRAAHGRVGIERHWPQEFLHDVPAHFHRRIIFVRFGSLTWALLFFRVVQGAGGGGLQPMAQAIMA